MHCETCVGIQLVLLTLTVIMLYSCHKVNGAEFNFQWTRRLTGAQSGAGGETLRKNVPRRSSPLPAAPGAAAGRAGSTLQEAVMTSCHTA